MNLTERLAELVEAPAPAMRIDIARATTVGRRRRIARRAAIGVGITAVAVVATVTTPVVLKSLRSPGPAAGPVNNGPPLITQATFGWLPDSITRVEFGTGAHGDYAHAVNENADLGTHLWLSVYPNGEQPKLGTFGPNEQLNVPAKPINGHAAYWATANASDPLHGGDAYLYWHVDGKLAELHGYYLGFFDNPQDVLLRVAAGATIGERAVPLPVKIKNMPAEFEVNEATFYRPMRRDEGTGAWDLRLFYYWHDLPAFTILVNPEGSRKTKVSNPYPCKKGEGVETCVAGADSVAADSLGGPQALLDHFTVLGLDESRWAAR